MPKTKWGSAIFTAYKFFDSKELLFFAVPEDIHTEGFAVAQHSLQGKRRPAPGRAWGGHSGGLPLAVGDTGAVLTGEGCSDVAFPKDIGSPILTKHFTRWSNSPNCQVTGRKVRSWNVIVLFSHCPTPPDVFMILRKLPRHKDAIYDRQKTIRLRPCEPESYCLPLRMSLSVF